MGKELLPNVDGHSFPARGIARSARLADDRAGMRSDRQIGVDTAEDHDLIRAMVIWRPPSAKAPPNPEGIRDDDATTLGENALDPAPNVLPDPVIPMKPRRSWHGLFLSLPHLPALLRLLRCPCFPRSRDQEVLAFFSGLESRSHPLRCESPTSPSFRGIFWIAIFGGYRTSRATPAYLTAAPSAIERKPAREVVREAARENPAGWFLDLLQPAAHVLSGGSRKSMLVG
jgi:hypothetical protein